MIITVCADKGSPGVSTTATALGLVWPGRRLLLEADPSGGDAALRLRAPAGGLLARAPTLRGLCVDIRGGVEPSRLGDYAQATSVGLPVICAADMRSEDLALVAGHWPAVARAAAGWPGTVIADVGRLQADNPAGALAAASALVLLVCRATPSGLLHLRRRAASLAGRLGQGPHGQPPLAVAVICPAREHKERLAETRSLLRADPATCNVPVAGWIAHDPRAVADLDTGTVTARLARSALLGTARDLAGGLLAGWPALAEGLDSTDDPPQDGGPGRAGRPSSAPGEGLRPWPDGVPATGTAAGAAGSRPAAAGSPLMTRGGWS